MFVLGSDYQRAVFARRKRCRTDELGDLWLISLEDLLLHKLMPDRLKDRPDVADLLLVCGGLDETYLRSWAAKLGVADRPEAALRTYGPDA